MPIKNYLQAYDIVTLLYGVAAARTATFSP